MTINETQRVLYEATRQLVRENGLRETTITQIVQCANLSRKTFYSYYKDKYELVNSICYTEWYEYEKESGLDNPPEAIRSILEFFERDPLFYRRVLEERGQNSFGDYLVNIFAEIMQVYLGEYLENWDIEPDGVTFMCLQIGRCLRDAIGDYWLAQHPELSSDQMNALIVRASLAYFSIGDEYQSVMKSAEMPESWHLTEEQYRLGRERMIEGLETISR